MRDIAQIWLNDLRAIPTTRFELFTAATVVTSARKRVHVMQSPNDRHLIRNRAKETRVVGEVGNPMQMNDVRAYPVPVKR